MEHDHLSMENLSIGNLSTTELSGTEKTESPASGSSETEQESVAGDPPRPSRRRIALRIRRRRTGRHRLSRRTTAVTGGIATIVVGGTVAAFMVGGSSPAGANENDWARLRQCESGNNYRINTGNGYYGAYQFDLSTWRAVGGSGLPSNASPAEQDARAHALYRERGWAPWECARILGLRPDPSDGYVPVTTIRPTVAAPKAKPGGSAIRLSGRATASSRVEIWAYPIGLWKAYHPIATVRAGSGGGWAHYVRLNHTTRYFVKAAGLKSSVATTRYLYRTNIYAVASRPINQPYTIIGAARPDSLVTIYYRRAGARSFIAGSRVRAGHNGHFQATWRARTDYQFFARSDTQSPKASTKVATTARGPLSISRPSAVTAVAAGSGSIVSVPLSGTARAGSLVHVYVRHAGQRAWRSVAAVHARRSGRWAVTLRAASSFFYFARSSTGQQSHAYQVAIR